MFVFFLATQTILFITFLATTISKNPTVYMSRNLSDSTFLFTVIQDPIVKLSLHCRTQNRWKLCSWVVCFESFIGASELNP